MKLVDNARQWYKMFSMQALTVIGVLQGMLIAFPERVLSANIPFTANTSWSSILVALTVAAAVMGAIGRLIDQGSSTDPSAP